MKPNVPADLITELAHSLARQLIDVGATCQRSHSFSVVEKSGEPLRSVYEVYGERVEKKLRELFPTEKGE
ncbi:MAG TPA: hypothetical protein VNX68_06810 [Nitrosopumilaceae archaeon]|jgi:hypothetical protein|nr:hypothetical protein [Nitrosopumilaceae archaeon]